MKFFQLHNKSPLFLFCPYQVVFCYLNVIWNFIILTLKICDFFINFNHFLLYLIFLFNLLLDFFISFLFKLFLLLFLFKYFFNQIFNFFAVHFVHFFIFNFIFSIPFNKSLTNLNLSSKTPLSKYFLICFLNLFLLLFHHLMNIIFAITSFADIPPLWFIMRLRILSCFLSTL